MIVFGQADQQYTGAAIKEFPVQKDKYYRFGFTIEVDSAKPLDSVQIVVITHQLFAAGIMISFCKRDGLYQ